MITVAIQRGSSVYVYGERNEFLFSKSGKLYGFTSTTVSIKKGNFIHTYSDKGTMVSTHYIDN